MSAEAPRCELPPRREPSTRVVLLGASNVQLGLPVIVRNARVRAGGPIDFLAALGHGRSFGRPSSIPGRTLPAIADCRLWADLADRPPMATHSLIADVGNDLLYGRSPRVITEWVAKCHDRLAKHGPVTLADLPVGNLVSLGEWRFRAFRTLFFPGVRHSLAELSDLAHDLHDRLTELAKKRGCQRVSMRSEWYGVDPIHFRWRARESAWQVLLSAAFWDHKRAAQDNTTSLFNRFQHASLWCCAAAERRLLGFDRHATQPCAHLRDGTRVSLY